MVSFEAGLWGNKANLKNSALNNHFYIHLNLCTQQNFEEIYFVESVIRVGDDFWAHPAKLTRRGCTAFVRAFGRGLPVTTTPKSEKWQNSTTMPSSLPESGTCRVDLPCNEWEGEWDETKWQRQDETLRRHKLIKHLHHCTSAKIHMLLASLVLPNSLEERRHCSVEFCHFSDFGVVVTGNPLPKADKSCAARARQFGRVSPKIVANPYNTFHKVNFFKILLCT